jgi:hypothetical protein
MMHAFDEMDTSNDMNELFVSEEVNLVYLFRPFRLVMHMLMDDEC